MTAGPRRRLAAVVAAGLLPWTVLFIGTELTVLFSFGLFNTNPPQLVSIFGYFVRYTDALPSFIESWGTGVLLYLLALGSAVSGVLWREDHRITALALLGAALSQIGVASASPGGWARSHSRWGLSRCLRLRGGTTGRSSGRPPKRGERSPVRYPFRTRVQ